MTATIGFILAIALLVYMIIRGIDMITATVVTAAVILVTSGLNIWEGFLTTYSGGIGEFVASWFLILGAWRRVRAAGLRSRAGYQNCKNADAEAGSENGGSRNTDLLFFHHTVRNQRLYYGVCDVSYR